LLSTLKFNWLHESFEQIDYNFIYVLYAPVLFSTFFQVDTISKYILMSLIVCYIDRDIGHTDDHVFGPMKLF